MTDVSPRQEDRRQASAIRRGDLVFLAICGLLVAYAVVVALTI